MALSLLTSCELVICVDSCFRNIALPKSEYDVASKKEKDVGYFV